MRKFFNFWLLIVFLVFITIFTNPLNLNGCDTSIGVLAKNSLSADSSDMIDEYIQMSRYFVSYDKYDRAITLINAVVSYQPGYNNIYNLLSSAYLAKAFFITHNNINEVKKSEEYKKALVLGRINIQKFSELSDSYEGLINTYIAIKDYSSAIRISKEACIANPNFENRCKKVADLYLEIGSINNALKFYKSLINNQEIVDKSWIYKKIGAIYYSNGDCINSQKYFNLSYNADDSNESLESTLNICYLNN